MAAPEAYPLGPPAPPHSHTMTTAERVAIVTGAGTGLGQATAHVLAEAGLRCVITGPSPAASRETVAQAPAELRDRLHVVPGDVAEPADRERFVAEALAWGGRLDVLVNNAGVSGRAPLLRYDVADWRRVMATNLEAAFFLSQAAIPSMREQGWGRIVNITSVYGSLGLNAELYAGLFEPDAGDGRQPAYHTSKGGLLNLTRDLAVAVAPYGITVNSLSPGMFVTEQARGILNEQVLENLSRQTPMGRFGEPREVGHAVRFLASEEAGFITGAELVVDGGWSIW